MSALFSQMREYEKWSKQNSIQLEKEYKIRLGDGKEHEFVPVKSYNGGQIYGVVVDNEKYILISEKKLKELIYKNKELNKDNEERNAKLERAEHDNTNNKQEKDKNKENRYFSITIYDVSDNYDSFDSLNVSAYMDSRGNIYTLSGGKFFRENEELKLDRQNDMGKFYADYMDSLGTPIDKEDMRERGIDEKVIEQMSQISSEADAFIQDSVNDSISLREMKENSREETFTTENHEITIEDVEREEKDIRYEN